MVNTKSNIVAYDNDVIKFKYTPPLSSSTLIRLYKCIKLIILASPTRYTLYKFIKLTHPPDTH